MIILALIIPHQRMMSMTHLGGHLSDASWVERKETKVNFTDTLLHHGYSRVRETVKQGK